MVMKKLSFPFIINSGKMMSILEDVETVSNTRVTVLLLGESGVGKEMIARSIHELGSRSNHPFVAVNCGAIPENLIESELFGYEEGAFTGAKRNGAPGKFLLAHQGIIFLDEVGDLSLNVQVKLLRTLQEREVTPLGGTGSKKIDVQVIAATNKPLEKLVEKGEFREDLYYRLNVVPISIPALRERVDEIPILIDHFTDKYNRLYDRNIRISQDAIKCLKNYHWPGNVRELENNIERLVITSKKREVGVAVIKNILPKKQTPIQYLPHIQQIMPLQDAIDIIEEQLITMAMDKYKSIKVAAKILDISQPTMSRKYKKIREKLQKASNSSTDKRTILEEQLDKRLRSLTIVTAANISAEEIIKLKKDTDMSPNNLYYQKLKQKLTMVQEREGIIEWVFIFTLSDDGKVNHLVADKGFVIEPGEEYIGPPEIMDVAYEAFKGKVGVTPVYKDGYGYWKTSFAPVLDYYGNAVAIIGCDYSQVYVETELKKIGESLNIKLVK